MRRLETPATPALRILCPGSYNCIAAAPHDAVLLKMATLQDSGSSTTRLPLRPHASEGTINGWFRGDPIVEGASTRQDCYYIPSRIMPSIQCDTLSSGRVHGILCFIFDGLKDEPLFLVWGEMQQGGIWCQFLPLASLGVRWTPNDLTVQQGLGLYAFKVMSNLLQDRTLYNIVGSQMRLSREVKCKMGAQPNVCHVAKIRQTLFMVSVAHEIEVRQTELVSSDCSRT
jgi:hypothetical protein